MRSRVVGRLCRSAVLLAAVALVGSCWLFDFSVPGVNLPEQQWYGEDPILIPFRVWGDSYVADVHYTFEAWTGAEWHVQDDRHIRLPSGSSGVLEYNSAGFNQHRLTFVLLQTHDATGVATPFLTATREFWIDTEPPDVSLITLTPNSDQLGGPPYSENYFLEVTVAGGEIDTPTGSNVRLFYTIDGSVPTEYHGDRIEDSGQTIWIWNQHEVLERFLRIMLIDDAGNRSSVRLIRYATF